MIIDFGIAKDANAGARTIVGNDFAGKYEYAAPEQMHGRAEPRSDLYALGASLLATFRGRVPDVGGSPGEIVAASSARSTPTGVPEPLKRLIDALTQPDPARRPPSAAAVVAEIDGAASPPQRRRPRAAGGGSGRAGGARARWPSSRSACRAAASGAPARPLPVAEPLRACRRPRRRRNRRLSAATRRTRRRGTPSPPPSPQAPARSPAPDALALAAGAPIDDWGAAAAALLAVAGPLEEWRLDLEDAEAALTGRRRRTPRAATR